MPGFTASPRSSTTRRPWPICRRSCGAASRRFASIGLNEARGTRLVSLSGAVRRPGLAEVPMGTTVRQVIDLVGGGVPQGRAIGFAAVGGPSSGLLPASELDVPLRPGMLHASGVVMGAGGITVFDDRASPIQVAARLSQYNAAESCGKCTPCREGTPRIAEALGRLAAGEPEGLGRAGSAGPGRNRWGGFPVRTGADGGQSRNQPAALLRGYSRHSTRTSSRLNIFTVCGNVFPRRASHQPARAVVE